MIFNKPLEEINASDILHLINIKYPENTNLDYKRELRLDTEYAKHDFVNDICAFANTDGGDLLIGVSEFDGEPSKVYGIRYASLTWKNADDYTKAVIDMARVYSEPNVPDINVRTLKVLDKTVMIIRVLKSYTGPHCHRGDNRFYVRVGNKKDLMDYNEIKNHFLNQEKNLNQITEFIKERTSNMYVGTNFAGMSDYPTFAMFFIPHDSFNFGKSLPVSKYTDLTAPYVIAQTEPLNYTRINIDGLLYHDVMKRGNYTLYYKNGIIESASTECFDVAHKSIDLARLTGVTLEITHHFFDYLKCRKCRNVYVVAAIINAKRYVLGNEPNCEPLDRDLIVTQPVVISTPSDESTLKPVFTELMSAFGYAHALLKYPGKPTITL